MEPEGENTLTLTKHDAHSNDDDDDPPMLSSQALEALKEFLSDQNRTLSDSTAENGGGSEVALVVEDWRLSQFWYEPETAETVTAEVLSLCKSPNCRVACIACPTLYAYLKKIDLNVTVQLLEYDKRFEQYGSDFTFYDYNQPEDLPSALKHSYQVVVADPPYLAGLHTRLGQWWEGIPFLTSSVVIVCGTIYLVCLLIGYDSFVEICFLPSAIISQFQVYRIFTSILFHGSLLHVIFNMMALVPLGSELERIMGSSVRLLYTIILLATSNAVFHLLIALLVAHIPFHSYPELMNECAIGFSGILFSMIVIETSLSGVQS